MTDETEQTVTDDLRLAACSTTMAGLSVWGNLFTEAADTIDALIAEKDRLTACLKKANSSAEHFEREWYLRGDELDTLRAQLAEARREAVSLARSLFKRHYAQEPHYASGKIEWEPFNNPASVISQIDNMAAGISAQLAEAQRNAERWDRAAHCVRLDQFGGFVVTPDEPAFAPDVSLAFTREIDASIDAARGETS